MLARILARSKVLPVALVLAGFLSFIQGASAQGLGEISLESSLNEPLLATIELLDVSGLNASQIELAIATEDEYQQAGLDRSALLNQIDFSVELFPLGRGLVTLSTEERVSEPYLSLLISARWPSGRVLREYTLLIDLPTFSDSSAGQQAIDLPANAPASTSSATGNTTSPGRNNSAAGASASTYTVASGDTMWEIAEQTRPSANVSVQQMMIAIQRANEDAFVNNNINRLLNGRVLRIPNQQEISIIEYNAAVAQINAQNEQMGLMRLGGTGSAERPAALRDELSVLTGDDAQSTGAGSSDLEATIAALESELMLSEEDLDRSRLENQDLTGQLGELEAQIDILQNIIAIEDERIGQLQAELTAQAEATDQALAEAAKAAQVLAASEEQAPPQGMVAQLLSLLQNNLILIGGALLVVLIVLGLLVVKSRRQAMAMDDDELDFTQKPSAPAPKGASRVEEDETDKQEAAPGFLAALLARFRKKSDDDDEDDYEESDQDESHDLTPESFANDLLDDDDFDADNDIDELNDPNLASDQGYDSDDDEEEGDDDAEVLASSVMDEVESALQEIDAGADDDIEDMEFDLVDTGSDDLEFDVSALGTSSVQDAADDNEIDDMDDVEITDLEETFEFSLKNAPETDKPAAAEEDAAEEEIESFSFSLNPKTETAAAPEATAADEADVELEKFEFSVAAKDSDDEVELEIEAEDELETFDLDLGNLTFDENDAKADADEESNYKPRTGMDECDTKLDLAVAYEAMGDVDGAMEILDEVLAEGKPAQIEEANRLKAKWQES